MTQLKRNAAVGFISQIIILIIGFIVPRIILVNYGSDTNGMTGTISQIFTYVALLQLGISSSARNVLYKYMKEMDEEGVSYWVSVSQNYYRRIAYAYAFIVILLAFILPIILNTDVGYWTVYAYTLFEGVSGALSFYYVNTAQIFLDVAGDQYVNAAITSGYKLICYLVKIILAIMGVNVAFIQVGYLVAMFVQIAVYHCYMNKKYPWVKYKETSRSEKLPDKNAYILSELSWVIFSSTDMIIISVFLSTSESSVYAIYNMVFMALSGLLAAIWDAVRFKLGLSYVGDIEQYKRIHDAYNSFFIGSITLLMCVCYILIIPFVNLYTSGVNDINYNLRWLPLFLSFLQILSWTRYVSGNLSGIAGYAQKVSYVSLVEAFINIFLSLVFVRLWGITGVVLASVMALPIRTIYVNWLCEKKILQRSARKTISIIGVNIGIFVMTAGIINGCHIIVSVDNIIQLFTYGITLFLLFAVIVIAGNCLINKDLLHPMKFYDTIRKIEK